MWGCGGTDWGILLLPLIPTSPLGHPHRAQTQTRERPLPPDAPPLSPHPSPQLPSPFVLFSTRFCSIKEAVDVIVRGSDSRTLTCAYGIVGSSAFAARV